ncbi:uncharacterized protein EV422DRAFT_5757 [Fimicolochytrium jonesii]|uniref:uncharacterized protein n=1 Tax=Fimicolochytrium jonesii TaxID=1396493 RepID=UPI0022FDCA7A|nr:uncharacterized protein EV422DRAFT_5757 [Fimicolochytrium jonesii]KAI8826665.1 hypothetical protein EV422DRAFT_5757 [Fimicolochytrium jonesii]
MDTGQFVASRVITNRKDCERLAATKEFEAAKKAKRFQADARSQILRQIEEDRQTMKERRKAPQTNASNSPSQPPALGSDDPKSAEQERVRNERRAAAELRSRTLGQNLQDQDTSQGPQTLVTEQQSLQSGAALPEVPPAQETSIAPAPSPRKSDFTTIQARFPSNTLIKCVLPASSSVHSLFAHIGQNAPSMDETVVSTKFTLLQPFPRRVFLDDDKQSLSEAGLCPSASLNVIRGAGIASPTHPLSGALDQGTAMDDDDVDDGDSSEMGVDGEENGDGGPVDMEVDGDESGDEGSMEEEEDDDDEDGVPGHGMGFPGHGFGGMGHGHHWGAGNRLTDGATVQPLPAVPLKRKVAAAKRRQLVPSLKKLTLEKACGMLKNPKTSVLYLSSLRRVAAHQGEELLQALIRNRQLDKTTLARLGPVRFQTMVLAHTPVSDSWCDLISAKWFGCLNKLDLKGCEVLTDQALQSLAALRQLEELDLTGCRITDHGIPDLADIASLQVLALSRTKITTTGLVSLSSSPLSKTLVSLNIAHCSITSNRIFPILEHFEQLDVVDITGVSLVSPAVAPRNGDFGLRVLEVGSTRLSDADLIAVVHKWSMLEVLGLRGCIGIGVAGLGAAAKLLRNLSQITFPSRQIDLTPVIGLYYDTPLTRLDLGGMINVTDETIEGLNKLAPTLTELDLSATKVTDASLRGCLPQLASLTHLHLDRTGITDETISFLKSLENLHTLSIASTNVRSPGLKYLSHSESVRMIRVLNLARTLVDDKGLPYLTGMVNLSALNLDGTKVTFEGVEETLEPALPNLHPLRLAGIASRAANDDEGAVEGEPHGAGQGHLI